MTDPTTPRTRMTREYLRISASSGSPLVPPRASPCVLDLLGLARPRAHAAVESIIVTVPRFRGGQVDELTDVRYEVDRGLAWITIDRQERLNAFRARTVDELIRCVKRAWADPEVGVICLTGAGDRAFCTGGDQKQRADTGDYGPSETGLFEVEYMHRLIREGPKPAIAPVNAYSTGGGHVLPVLCALT